MCEILSHFEQTGFALSVEPF